MNAAIRDFGDIPTGSKFADKFGRIYTKSSGASATAHEVVGSPDDDYWWPQIDNSRQYFEFTEDDAEDDPDVFSTWPYYVLDEATK